MPVRPSWHDEYWKKLDKETAAKMRTTCLKAVHTKVSIYRVTRA